MIPVRVRLSIITGILLSLQISGSGISEQTSAPAPIIQPIASSSWDHTEIVAYVKDQAADYGWTNQEWLDLVSLIDRESRWNPQANNPRSTAFGLFQILKTPEDTTIEQQTDRGLRYILSRYGSPSRALAFWKMQADRGSPWY